MSRILIIALAVIIGVAMAPFIRMNEDNPTREEFNNLKLEVEALKSKPADLQYPMSEGNKNIFKDVLKEIYPEISFESDRENYFRFFAFFDSLDGWGLAVDGAGTGVANFQSVNLTTGIVLDDAVSIGKDPVYQDILTYEKPAFFRTAFQMASVSNVEFFAGIGVGGNGAVGNHYGILVVDNHLRGVVGNGSSQKMIELVTIDNSHSYLVEVRFYPKDKVVFLVKDTSDNITREKGIITGGLPIDSFTNWAYFEIVNKIGGVGTEKTVNFSFFEYGQEWPDK